MDIDCAIRKDKPDSITEINTAEVVYLYDKQFNFNFKTCTFNFIDSGFRLSNKSKVIGHGALFDGLFHIQLHNDATYNSMHVTAGLKRCVRNEESSMLWHRRLGHISIERMKKFVNDGVLSTLDFVILRLM